MQFLVVSGLPVLLLVFLFGVIKTPSLRDNAIDSSFEWRHFPAYLFFGSIPVLGWVIALNSIRHIRKELFDTNIPLDLSHDFLNWKATVEELGWEQYHGNISSDWEKPSSITVTKRGSQTYYNKLSEVLCLNLLVEEELNDYKQSLTLDVRICNKINYNNLINELELTSEPHVIKTLSEFMEQAILSIFSDSAEIDFRYVNDEQLLQLIRTKTRPLLKPVGFSVIFVKSHFQSTSLSVIDDPFVKSNVFVKNNIIRTDAARTLNQPRQPLKNNSKTEIKFMGHAISKTHDH